MKIFPSSDTQQEQTIFPASSAQQRMWFLQQLAPSSPRYNVTMSFQIQGPIQVALLERCLHELVVRHEALRTTFALQEDGLVQIIHAFQQPPFSLVDLRPFEPEERSTRMRQLIEQAELCPFDLSQPPLLRMQLLRLDEQEWVLQSVFHHIATDGWSQERFYRELSLLYDAFATEQPCPLPPVTFRYTDYTQWQQHFLAGPQRETQRAYWQQQLADAPALLELPTDAPRPERPSYQGAASRFFISKTLADRVRAFGQETNTTPFMMYLVAFQTLLFRYSGQDDIVVGAPAAGRSRPEFEAIQGLFVNTLALRSHFSADLTFRTLLAEVRRTCLEAYAHQEIPFDQVVDVLHIERSLRYQPLCQAMISYQLGSSIPLQLLDCDIRLIDTSQVSGGFDVVLGLRDTSEGVYGTWSYSTELFLPARIQRQSGHFQHLLEQMLAYPDESICSHTLLTEQEEAEGFASNATAAWYPQQCGMHHLVERQAFMQPDAVAVVSSHDQEITYQELNARANQLARFLQAEGIGPEDLVGVCLERSPEMIIAQLGILKAGAAYVPLAPDYPAERLAYMFRDTGMPVVLTLQRFSAHIPPTDHALRVIAIDQEWSTIDHFARTNLARGEATVSDALAHVIYTSGSTGQPKGVRIPHRAVIARLASKNNLLCWRPGDRLAHAAHPCFDASTFEIWGALMNGATVVILEKDDLLSPTRLARLLREKSISFLFLTTALFNQFAATMPEMFDTLQTLAFGGEAVNPDAARTLLDHPGHPQTLLNAYGPTECAMYVTCFSLEQWQGRQGAVPIGHPIANTEILLLDEHMLPVPVGNPAEIFAGGPGLAQGYLGRPDLTAERFVPHPFRKDEKLYRTGDLGISQEDGTLQFVGRTDRQVKLRGYRIELGEIEAVLREHPSVREALVRIHEDTSGERYLVAYLLPTEQWENKERSVGEIRDVLVTKLPGYMIPTSLMCLDAWPLSPNGKINYRALPAPALGRPQSERSQGTVQARTEMERLLVKLWQEIFAREHLSISASFFDLGGHSLLAAQLVGRLSTQIGREISVVALFEHPTIEQLAAFVQDLLADDTEGQAYLPLVASPATSEIVRKSEEQGSQAPVYTVRETRSLLSRLLSGSLPAVDAVTLGYLAPSSFPLLAREEVVADLLDGLPVVASLLETPYGRLATMPLPLFNDQLFEREQLLAQCQEALCLAKQMGARTVSLGGLLPVATQLGEALGGESLDLPPVSTGHAAIASAIVLSLKRILTESGRSLEQAHLGLLGIGSIGRAFLPVLLALLPHPNAISLCDLYASPDMLEDVARQLRHCGFQGAIEVVPSTGGRLPSAFYAATVLVSLTNVPDVIDIAQLAPGTLLVDDSIPTSFQIEEARARLEQRGDILFTQGRMLSTPQPLTETVYLPQRWARAMGDDEQVWQHFQQRDPQLIPACALSSLLASCFADLPPTIGQVGAEMALHYAQRMRDLGLEAAPLACDGYIIPQALITAFRTRFRDVHC